jgi:hypothetical protein
MVCTLTQFSRRNKHHFAVRASDTHGRFGPFPILRVEKKGGLCQEIRDELLLNFTNSQRQHIPAEGTDLGKLPEDDPPPEEKYHLEMSSKEKPLRKVQVALDSSVARSLELDIETGRMEKMTPPI